MRKLLFTALASATMLATIPAYAQDGGDWLSKDRFQIRLRGIAVAPDEDSSVNIGGDVDVGNSFTPEVDLTYFLTDNIALEAISRHSPA